MKGQKKILADLKSYAATQVISVPATGPEYLRETHTGLYDEDEDFDKKWCREMINENEKLIKVFEEYNERKGGDLKTVVAGSLPTLRSHQDKLHAYQDAVAVND